jgi:5-deoxy-glucuronate isomerase
MTWLRPAGSLAAVGDPVRLQPDEAGWDYCGLHVFALSGGGTRTLHLGSAEAAVVPLAGGCRVEIAGGDGFDLEGRASVFSGPTDVAFVPRGATVTLIATETAEVAVATAVATEERPAFRLASSDVEIEIRGRGQATRQVNGLLSAGVPGPQRLIIVEVLTPAGNWSSYPPHKHDEWTDTEVPLEEIYYFRLGGDGGFGLHRAYTPDGDFDETVTVRDGDVYLIPRGYHGPSVAAPGYDMYYLNVMAGPDPQRRWLISMDPAHDWVTAAWESEPPDPRVPVPAPGWTTPEDGPRKEPHA